LFTRATSSEGCASKQLAPQLLSNYFLNTINAGLKLDAATAVSWLQ
jgi:hypothetical protein